MPNGITAAIYDGKDVTLRDYLMRVGRSLGMAIVQRDDPADAPVKLRKVDQHYYTRVARAKDRLLELTEMTAAEADAEAVNAWAKEMNDYHGSVHETDKLKARYQDMVVQVVSWDPGEHAISQAVKARALQHLEESIQHDCSPLKDFVGAPVLRKGEDWRDRELERAARELRFAESSLAAEEEHVAGDNEAISAFLAALPEAG